MLKPGIHRVKNNASNSELQAAIEAVIPMATKQMQSRANQFKGATEQETCKKIFDYLKALNYKADGNEQQVRLPSGLVRTQTGDCKSYAVFTSAVLSNLKIPHYLVYTSYNPADKTPTHVYVTTKNNCIIDAVWGKFNSEKKPTHKIKKPMNISYIAGTGKRMGASCSNNNTSSGIMGDGESAIEWAKRNGILPYQNATWLAANSGLYRKYAATRIPFASGRLVLRAIIAKNGGGIATSLNKIMLASRSESKGQPNWEKMRAIEINYLENGGDPTELYESISKGASKTPTGQYFNKLMKMKASGYNPNIAQWIAAGVSLMFGKKYNESTGKITGVNTITQGIGDAGATEAALLKDAPVWAKMTAYIVNSLGAVYILAKVGGPDDTPNPTPGSGGDGGNGGDGGDGTGTGARSFLTPLLLIGGAAAAYFLLIKKK